MTHQPEQLCTRALNRALLERQLLLRRTKMPVLQALEHLAGLQAQAPLAPYYALWSRLADFRQEALVELLLGRRAVRVALMRATLHLVSAQDALALRPLLQPVLERGLKGSYGKALADADLQAIAAAGRALVEERPQTFSELGSELAAQWPGHSPAALAAAVRTFVPLVQVPPRGIWGTGGAARHTSAEVWLAGLTETDSSSPEAAIVRYLTAFGPAGVKDMQVWCGLTKLRETVERLRPQLRVFRDERGAELFDLPDAPRPASDTPAPVRFLGEFDNMLLSLADRSRILDEAYRPRVFTANGIIRATVLVDGFVRGLWRIERQRGAATLIIELFAPVTASEQTALAEEGEQLLAFAEPDAQSRSIAFAAQSAY